MSAKKPSVKRILRPQKPKPKSRIQILKEQPPADIIGIASNLYEEIVKVEEEITAVSDTLSHVKLTSENLEATARLLDDLRSEADTWSKKLCDLKKAFVVYRDSTVCYVKDRALANLYVNDMNQSLLPPELT